MFFMDVLLKYGPSYCLYVAITGITIGIVFDFAIKIALDIFLDIFLDIAIKIALDNFLDIAIDNFLDIEQLFYLYHRNPLQPEIFARYYHSL